MKRALTFPIAAALVLLAACGRDQGQGGLTAEEERQLDEAARMLDDNMIDVLPDSLVANEADLEAVEAAQDDSAEPPPANAR